MEPKTIWKIPRVITSILLVLFLLTLVTGIKFFAFCAVVFLLFLLMTSTYGEERPRYSWGAGESEEKKNEERYVREIG